MENGSETCQKKISKKESVLVYEANICKNLRLKGKQLELEFQNFSYCCYLRVQGNPI